MIVKGKPEESLLVKLIREKDPEKIMPPPASHKTMSPDHIALLEKWIEQGAGYEAHWSFIPVKKPAVPEAGAGLPQAEMAEVLDGMEMDLTQTRYLDEAGLNRYCHCVAGVVGTLSARLFGYTDPKTLEFAEKLGLSLQLVNILRDVGEDARRGRIYLPVNTLQQFQVPASEILKGQHSERFVALMQYHAERARKLYREALAALPRQDRRAQRAGLLMGAIYHALLDELEASQFQVLSQRIALTPLRKLWIAWKTWIRNS